MLFSSITFLYYFFPLVILIYYIAPKLLKNAVILLFSLFFYGWGEPKYIILMIFAIIQGYVFGLVIEKLKEKNKAVATKICLVATVVLSLGMLVYFKYADFFIENFNAVTGFKTPLLKIALPIGISFYTFQILSYSIDVYRGNAKAQKNLINFGAYVSMFPQLIAGPIVRYSDIEKQLDNRKHTLNLFSEGLKRFIIGLSKKVLIANILGELVENFKTTENTSVLFVWTYAIAYSLHIYFDFSGYSDMAIGLGKIFGFYFPENFNYPFISSSATEFWRRWHMSLGSWFRDYLYIPLGGNRVSKSRWFLNILVVWLATGFWHGAAWNFILWGLMFAFLLIIEKLFLKKFLDKFKIISHIYLTIVVIISFVIFDNINILQGFEIIKSMFFVSKIPLATTEAFYCLKNYLVILIVAIVGSTPLLKFIITKIKNTKGGNLTLNILEPFVLIFLLAVVTSFLIDGSFNPFLYFRF